MKCKMYQICLFAAAVAATAGGLLCCCAQDKKTGIKSHDGLPDHMQYAGERIRKVGRHAANEFATALEQTSQEVKDAATATGHEWKHAARSVGREIREELQKGRDHLF